MDEAWKAEGACPQCGADVTLEVGDPVLSCTYCRTGLFLSSDGPLRYRLGPPASGPDHFYLPFWRFRGLRFLVFTEPRTVQANLLDATVPAWPKAPTQATLGLRPQLPGLRLTGGGPVSGGERPEDEALAEAEARVDWLESGKALFTRFVGETRSIVEAPFALEDGSRGARLRELLPDGRGYELDPDQSDALRSFQGRPHSNAGLAFLPLICPECGHDLPSDPNAVAFLCGECARAWRVNGAGFSPLPYAAGAAPPGSRFFPFWELSFTAEGLPLRTRADLSRWAAAYRPVPPVWGEEPCRALVPGFKVHPRSFLRLARLLSLAPVEVSDQPLSPSRPFQAEPVRLPHAEAVQALKVVLAAMAGDRRRAIPAVHEARLRVDRVRLTYLPFVLRGAEWVQEPTGLALQANSVSRGAVL